MDRFVEVIKQNPSDLLSNDFIESDIPLSMVKTYLDDVIRLSRQLGNEKGCVIDEVVVEGLDANQVWLQAKIVLETVEVDLLQTISKLRDAMTGDSSDEESDERINETDSSVDIDNSRYESAEEGTNHSPSLSDGHLSSHSAEESEVDDDEEEKEANEDKPTMHKDLSKQTGKDVQDDEKLEHEFDKYGINDRFFDLEEFNRRTLEAEDSKGGLPENSDEEDIDYFGDVPSDDEEEVLYYDDFFDNPEVQKHGGVRTEKEQFEDGEMDELAYNEAMESAKLDLFAESDDEEEDVVETKPEKLSTYQTQQLEIQKQIELLEKENIAEKKWALKGEVKAKDRPADALLTEELEFDRTAKPVPVITSAITESLEDMIRRRIKDMNFDDLPRRVVSNVSTRTPKPKFELSDVKSSKSLAELYEDDYNGNKAETKISEDLQKAHDEISELYKSLVYKLDALSSANFIPKPAQKSLDIKVQSAAISMEDAQPLAVSTASILAPHEIYRVGKSENKNEITLKNGTVMSRDELARSDKNRLRRAIKRKRANAASSRDHKEKKSKKEDVLETLSKAKNVTIINKRGEKQDIKGNKKQSPSTNVNFKL
ncbi:HHL003Cp [Eremothecium sinecaudum]|uniref:U3 small nucleolar ribonucleoprotein protein MPP10 n=1 Tax=Eremothecium sinecaudum TaxID=45286 RepID=A0A0X8HWI4_9SACH|nr:HHL003Cp [Eremothecium sinecaudum]AMD22767.1 HHL003Cp [Eremothecium sinecaudum]